MQNITLLCVGKLKERFYVDAAAEYAKRLSPYCRLTVVEVPEARLSSRPTSGDIAAALSKEAASIREKMPPSATVVALCIEGQLRSSEELARMLSTWAVSGRRLVFLIGGSHGLDPTLKAEAHTQISMSPMTFPHHLARIMLLEQLYRGYQINAGTQYHK